MPMLTLKFKKDSRKLGEYQIEQGQSMTIGRLNDNDIVIENLAVSGHHAKIDTLGSEFLMTDLQSKNGTFVNEQLTHSHKLRHGDVITIGKHMIVFTYVEGEAMPDDAAHSLNETMVMDTGKYREMLAKNVSDAGAPAGAGSEPMGILSFLTGGEGEMELSKKLTKIGKNPSSDIVISGLTVGQTSATISKRPDGYYLSYVSGMAKPKVNGKAVKESVSLKQFDTIEIGSVKMEFLHKS